MSERINEEAPFDILGDIFSNLRFCGTIFFCSELSAPWGVSVPESEMPRFHIVMNGECAVGTENTQSLNIKHMDIVLLPNGPRHWVADREGRDLISLENAQENLETISGTAHVEPFTHKIMCGQVRYDRQLAYPVLESLPEILYFPGIEASDPVWQTVVLIDSHIEQAGRDSNAVVDRLTEALFLLLLRRYAENNLDSAGFLAVLHDRRLQRALVLMHRDSQCPWTLGKLSQETGMSSATLVRRFQAVLGMAPIAYLTRWRLIRAFDLIKNTREPLQHIAETVGFATAQTLNKAFRRQYGRTPTEVRRREIALENNE